jgi:hypothetical protein
MENALMIWDYSIYLSAKKYMFNHYLFQKHMNILL